MKDGKRCILHKKVKFPLSVILSIRLSLFISLPLSFSLLGTRKLEYAGSTWHEGCFICHSCEQPIGSKSFIPDKDEHYCVQCYEDKFAPRCTRCKKVSKVWKYCQNLLVELPLTPCIVNSQINHTNTWDVSGINPESAGTYTGKDFRS